ncbi:MAG: dethiobiotin synthase [Cyanobacteria bacterium M_surface_10_m2_179]|nr:dethiobiotin synthase [Cyanobacteria bacterium M_surface_10_m2_179]
MSRRLVVCGTDTDVGKTVVSALLVQGLGARYWKPVQCGLENGEGDRDRVQRWLQLPAERILPEAYRLQAPVSPHWASQLEGGEPGRPGPAIDPDRLQLPGGSDPLVVETAGGLLVPLRLDLLQIDLLQRWQLPVLLVGRSGLGTLNHTLLSLEALQHRQIPLIGVLLNGEPHPNNLATLQKLAGVPLLGCLPPLQSLNAHTLAGQWQELELSHKLQA